MRIFLTGASGYLGGVLLERLSRLPEVETITAIALNKPKQLPAKVTFQRMDIRSPELAAAMAGHDAVVHTACIVLWSARMSARERDDINLNGTQNVAQAVHHNRIPRFIHTSSMAAYHPAKARGRSLVEETFPLGDGQSPYYYWNAKALAEQSLTRLFGSSATLLTLLRPIYITGPRNRANALDYRKNAVHLLGSNPRRQFIHEADVAEAFVLALRQNLPGAYNLVPDDYMRMTDVYRIVGAKRVPTVPCFLARLITWIKWRFFHSPIHPCWVDDMLIDFTGANNKLKAMGWKPVYSSAGALRSALSQPGN